MTDIVDRLKERCWPLDNRDELCMDAVYVITDLRARLAEAEYAKAGLEGAVRIVDARVNKALNILDLIDTDGDDHYYSNGE